ncbi:MAG: hypothetical protein NVS3B20_03320 [Polyangiales bacterium]
MTRTRRFVRAFSRLLRWMKAKPHLALAFGVPVYGGCLSAMTPRGKLDDAVQEVNMAARFGRNDIASERVAVSGRAGYVKRHRLWGNDVRIVDMELSALEKSSQTEAVVLVGFSWFRPNEGTLRATMVRQTWKTADGTGPWFLVDEERASGDVGLLGEPTVVVLAPPKSNAQFETTVIRER